MILALKTDGDATSILLLDKKGRRLAAQEWESGRRLAEGLLQEIEAVLEKQSKSLQDLTGLIVFRGPGSFTSLRIGISTINALAYALAVPCVGTEGENWLKDGLKSLAAQDKPQIITPFYDREPNTTKPNH